MPCKCKTEGCNLLADCGDEYCPSCLIDMIDEEGKEAQASANAN